MSRQNLELEREPKELLPKSQCFLRTFSAPRFSHRPDQSQGNLRQVFEISGPPPSPLPLSPDGPLLSWLFGSVPALLIFLSYPQLTGKGVNDIIRLGVFGLEE